jgi:hypothetical protein
LRDRQFSGPGNVWAGTAITRSYGNSADEENVKSTLAILGLLVGASAVHAHGGSGGSELGWFRGPGFGGFSFNHHGELGSLGLGFGLGLFDAERTQERFENRFDNLMTRYEEGVAGEDFFSTNEYDRIVDGTELLSDRYSLFVSGVERNIDRLTDIISIANDDLTYFNDLLADYQADEDLSAERLARIERWINRVTDALDTKIDYLTDKQSTLQTNLPTYQSFQTDITTFLSDIVAAGSGTTDTSADLTSLASLMSAANDCPAGSLSLAPASVPEPSVTGLILLSTSALLAARKKRHPSTATRD